MARKESITKEMLLLAAFDMVKEEGIESLTARKLAAKAADKVEDTAWKFSNKLSSEWDL